MNSNSLIGVLTLLLRGVRQDETLSNKSLSSKEKNFLHTVFVSSYISLFVEIFYLDTRIVSNFDFFVNNKMQLFGLMLPLMAIFTYSIYTKYMYENIKDMQAKVLKTLGLEVLKRIFKTA